MRFLLNFFLFGFLFYLIYLFFPEAFQTLVSWAGSVYDFFKDLFHRGMEGMSPKNGSHPEEAPKSILNYILYFV